MLKIFHFKNFIGFCPVANLINIFTIINYDFRGIVTRELPILQL